MACRPPGSGSYTVVIIPLRTNLYSLDALRFYLWVKRLKDLEREKDSLQCGLEVLDQARLWYHQRLEDNRVLQASKGGAGSRQEGAAEVGSCLLRSRIQRVNGCLGSVMGDPNVTGSGTLSLPDAVADSDLRWHNTVLAQEVSDKNRQISLLEMEREALLQQLSEHY
ncbi:suppressor APC domain-containing protein 1 [Diretmus argenteus]